MEAIVTRTEHTRRVTLTGTYTYRWTEMSDHKVGDSDAADAARTHRAIVALGQAELVTKKGDYPGHYKGWLTLDRTPEGTP